LIHAYYTPPVYKLKVKIVICSSDHTSDHTYIYIYIHTMSLKLQIRDKSEYHPYDCGGCLPPPLRRYIAKRQKAKSIRNTNKKISEGNQTVEKLTANRDEAHESVLQQQGVLETLDHNSHPVEHKREYNKLVKFKAYELRLSKTIDAINTEITDLKSAYLDQECVELIYGFGKELNTAVKSLDNNLMDKAIDNGIENRNHQQENNQRMEELLDGSTENQDVNADDGYQNYLKILDENKEMEIQSQLLAASSHAEIKHVEKIPEVSKPKILSPKDVEPLKPGKW
jgi:hypothetical protein